MSRPKACVTCRKSQPVDEFYVNGRGWIRLDCNTCRGVVTVPLKVPLSASSSAEERRALREAKAPGYCTEEQLAARWNYYGGRCWMCRKAAVLMDHVKPLVRGGCKWPSNLRPACWGCNTGKAKRWPYPTRALAR